MLGSVHDQLTLDGPHTMRLVLGIQLMPGNHQSIHVGDRTSGRQDGIPVFKPDDLSHFPQAFMLHQNENRGNLVRKHVGVGGGRQPFAGHGDDVQTSGELVEESRMSCKGKKIISVLPFRKKICQNRMPVFFEMSMHKLA